MQIWNSCRHPCSVHLNFIQLTTINKITTFIVCTIWHKLCTTITNVPQFLSHLILGELQGFSWGTLTKEPTIMQSINLKCPHWVHLIRCPLFLCTETWWLLCTLYTFSRSNDEVYQDNIFLLLWGSLINEFIHSFINMCSSVERRTSVFLPSKNDFQLRWQSRMSSTVFQFAPPTHLNPPPPPHLDKHMGSKYYQPENSEVEECWEHIMYICVCTRLLPVNQ